VEKEVWGIIPSMQWALFRYLVLYLALLLGIGLAFSRRMKSLEVYFLAARGLSGFWVFLSLCASWIGSASILVSLDEAHGGGVRAFWVVGAPAVLSLLVFAVFLAGRIRRLSILTLPDLVEMRYGATVRHVAALLIIWYMVLLAASQMVALGNFLQGFLGTSYVSALALGALIVLLYSVWGGYVSVVFTDGFQFFLLMAGMLWLFFFLVGAGADGETARAADIIAKEEHLNLFSDIPRDALIVLSFTLAWIISPIAWQRIQSAGSGKSAKRALTASAAVLFLFYGMVVAMGLFSRFLTRGEEMEEPVLSWMISHKAGHALGGVLFVAVVAAIMSTMDTAINTGAFSLAHDGFGRFRSVSVERRAVLVSRVSTVLVGGAAFLVATRFQSILRTLGLASEIMAEGLFLPGVAMLFAVKRRPAAGLLSLVGGGGHAFVGFLCGAGILPWRWPEWPYSVPRGLAMCAAGFFLGLVLDLIFHPSDGKK